MTHAGPASPVLTMPFGRGDAAKALTRAIATADARGNLGRALRRLPNEARSAVVRDIIPVAAGLLDVNLVDALITGWQKHHQLTEAARRTLAAPGSSELVDLVKYQVTSSHQPYVSVLIDGQQVATVQLGLTVVFDISGMLAKVSAGRLVAVETGDCTVTATLAIDGAQVISRQERHKLPGSVPLRGGIRLLHDSAYQVPAQQARAVDGRRLTY